jgi:hypothetical protein
MSSNIIELPRPLERAGHAVSPRAGGRSAPTPLDRAAETSTPAPRTVAPLPEGVAFTDRAVAALRDYLARNGLPEYQIFYNYFLDVDMDDVDQPLDRLGEPSAAWAPLSESAAAARDVTDVRFERDGPRAREPGCIHLARHQVVLARWFWMDPANDCLTSAWLLAAPTADHNARLRDAVR